MLTILNFEYQLNSFKTKVNSFRGWYIMEVEETRNDYYSIILQKNVPTDFDWVEIRLGMEADKEFPYDRDSDDVYKLQFVHKDGSVIYEHWLGRKWLKKTTAYEFMERVGAIIENYVENHPNLKLPF
jgi:hypothetical protein